MKRKKNKFLKEFILTSIFTLFFVICLTPVKQSNANPLLAAIIKAVASESGATAVAMEKFDLLKDFLKDNGFSTEGMTKQDIFDKAQEIKNDENFEPKSEASDLGAKVLNDLFGSDDFIFFKTDSGYDFISKPSEDGFGFMDVAKEFLANTATDTMQDILHPIDSAMDTAKSKINDTIHPIEAIEKQFSFMDGESNYLDKFDIDKYADKNKSDDVEEELERDLMEQKLDVALEGLFEQLYYTDNDMSHAIDGLFEQLYYTDNDLEWAIDGVFQQLYDQQELEHTLNSLGDQQEQMIFDTSSINNLHP